MKRTPNVIIINIDDMGYADLGCYGSKLNNTPTIDNMAKNGLLLTDFYAAASVCTPARAGLLTGCHPKRIDFMQFGVYDYRNPKEKTDDFVVLMPGQPEGLNSKEKTLAHLFKEKGYSTKMIGKWHLGDQPEFLPTRLGFDEYFGIPYSNDMGVHKENGLTEKYGYLGMFPLPVIRDEQVVQQQPDCAALAERFTVEATDFIHNQKNKPFFLYFAHHYIHHPLYAIDRFLKESKNGVLGAVMASIDNTVAAIQHELKRSGQLDNTIIILMSDNGGDFRSINHPLRGYKGSCFEGGHRVSCVISWHEGIKQGRVSSDIVCATDLYATFCEMLNINDDGIKRDSISFYNLLCGKQMEQTREHIAYYASNKLAAVRVGAYKYHLASKELYNLKSDISENIDISNDHPKIVADMILSASEIAEDLGDENNRINGQGCREKGFCKHFEPLTFFDALHPYIIPFYD